MRRIQLEAQLSALRTAPQPSSARPTKRGRVATMSRVWDWLSEAGASGGAGGSRLAGAPAAADASPAAATAAAVDALALARAASYALRAADAGAEDGDEQLTFSSLSNAAHGSLVGSEV